MASSYVNDLRLNEMATGDASGSWGTNTNTNLSLIGEALGFGTEGITTNADTHTSTVADGATDPVRAMYVKYTGTLDSACTITIAPNTINRMQFIENGTSGSQNIIISQGSGANVTIPAGDVKAVYLDGAGSGAAVVDAFASLSVVDLKVQDDLTVTDDLIVGGDIDLEGAIDVNGTANLDVVDIDGAVDMASTLQVDGAITSSAGATITLADNTDNLTLTTTDADASVGPNLRMYRNSGSPADNDLVGAIDFEGRNDNSQDVVYSQIFTQILDASDGTEDGYLSFKVMNAGTSRQRLLFDAGETVFNDESQNVDFRVESDGDANMLFVDGGANTVGIGTGTPGDLLHVTNGDRAVDTRIRLDAFGQLPIFNILYAAGTQSSPTAATSGTEIFRIASSPYDGNDYSQSAMNLRVVADADFSSNSTPAHLAFDINNTTRLATEAMRITSTSTLLISDTTAITGTTFDARDVDNVTSLAIGNNAGYVTRGQDTTAGANFILQANRGTLTSPANSNNGDNCGQILFRAYHTNGHYTSSIIRGIQDGPNGTNDMPGTLQFSTSADGSATPSEGMRLNLDADFCVGATTYPTTSTSSFGASTGGIISTARAATNLQTHYFLQNPNGTVGTIKTTGSATQFNTSSDYRLKENVVTDWDGTTLLKQLKPSKFNFKADTDTTIQGFLAHEVSSIVPLAVSGEKDDVYTYEDEMNKEGTRGQPKYQAIDHSKLVPVMVKTIQELEARITTLEG